MRNTKPPTVSVVIPCYNSDKFVEDAVLSALNQTYPVDKIVCIDDGSTDNTGAILSRLAEIYDRVTVLSQSNQGPASARNKGIRCCTSEYIQFLDADDILLPDKIKNQATLIQKSDWPDIVIGSYTVVDANDGKREDIVIEVVDVWKSLVDVKMGTMCSNMFKKAALEEIGLFRNDTHVEDTDLYFRLLKRGSSYAVDELLLTIIRRHKNCRSEKREPLQKSKIKLLGAIRSHLAKKNMLYSELRNNINGDILNRSRELYSHNVFESCELHSYYMEDDFNIWKLKSQPHVYKLLYSLLGFRLACTTSPYIRFFIRNIKIYLGYLTFRAYKSDVG